METHEQTNSLPVEREHYGVQRESYDITLKTLAVVGLLVVLLGGTWVGFRAISYLPSIVSGITTSFASVASFVLPFESIETVASSQTLESGVPFTLSWRHEKKDDGGSYALSYPCTDTLYFIGTTPAGSKTVFCNTPFNLIGSENSVTLTPFYTGEKPTDIFLTISFTKNGRRSPSLFAKTLLTIQK